MHLLRCTVVRLYVGMGENKMAVTMLSDVAHPHNSDKIGKLEAVKINSRHLPFGL